MNNTRIDLMYRDGCNYKAYGYVVLAGPPDPALVQRLTATLEAGQRLVPEQVGLTHPGSTEFAPRFPDEEEDHGWTDVMGVVAVDAESSDGRTFAVFVAACENAAADGWDPMIAIDAAGGWTDPEMAAELRGGEDEDADEGDVEGGLVFPKFVTLDEPDVRNLPDHPVPDGQVRLVLQIENTYELYDDVTTYADVMVPAPPAGDEGAGEFATPREEWGYKHVYPLTGVGHIDGGSWYDVTVVWSSDAALVGSTFSWGY